MNAGTSELARSTPERRERADREISIRPIDAADGPGLAAFYAGLTPRSTRQRFLGSREPDPKRIAEFPATPGVVAILAERGPRDGEIVAHASIHPDRRGAAEAAFAVADELQGQGVGSRLMAATVAHARSLGIHRLDTLLYADNARMRRLLLHSGRALVTDDMDAGIEEMSLDLDRVG
jgi:acetyltransferase